MTVELGASSSTTMILLMIVMMRHALKVLVLCLPHPDNKYKGSFIVVIGGGGLI
jgi:hypothetical protein